MEYTELQGCWRHYEVVDSGLSPQPKNWQHVISAQITIGRTGNYITSYTSDLDCSSSPCLSGGEPRAETGAKDDLRPIVSMTALI